MEKKLKLKGLSKFSIMLRPTAKEVKILDNYILYLKFDNGEEKLFDTKALLSRKPYMPLSNRAIYKTVHINGITIEWNEDIDICPDELYYNSVPVSKQDIT